MAVRSYNGRVMNTNPTMNGAGSAASVNNWIGSSTFGWGIGQTTSGAATGEYTTFFNEDCVKLVVTGLTRSGATIGQVNLNNIPVYTGPTVSVANLNINAVIVEPGRQYKLDLRYFIESTSVVTGTTVRLNFGITFYNSNGTRLTGPSDFPTPDTSVSTDWIDKTLTLTAPQNAKYAVLRVSCLPNSDPTTGGAMTFYVSTYRCTEVLPARTTITTPRATATRRVAVRDMGTALRFNSGGTDRVDLGSAIGGSLAASGVFTLEVYANRTNATYAMPICLAGGGVGKIGIAITATGTVQGRITNGANTEINFASTRIIANSTFNRLTLTFDGSTARIYINGTLAATQAYVGLTVANDVNYVGQRPTNNDRFNGIIDEVRIWNRALSDTEIANLHFSNIVPRTGLLREYLFNEASGTTAIDTGSDAVNGTITGATYTLDTPLDARTLA